VVIPCYRYGHYLEGCVRTVLDQPGVDVDVLIVDDASPDDTSEVAGAIAASEPRVQVLRHPVNLGHIATYNDGLGAVDGTYVVLLSADDLLTPGALARATALLEAHPSVGFVYGNTLRFSEVPSEPSRTEPSGWQVWSGHDWLEHSVRLAKDFVLTPSVVMRTDVLRSVGGYRPELPHAGDYEMWLRAAAVSDVGYVLGADQAWYRVHSSSMHSTVFRRDDGDGLVIDLEQRLLSQDLLFDWVDDGLDGAGELRNAGRRALAREALALACRAYAWGITDRWPVDDLEAFARRTWPESGRLRQARALAWRRRMGPRWARRNPAYRAQTLLFHLRERRTARRWIADGVW
jgi:glycosyltransferase involved in cell wall biosynthesis